MYLPVSIPNHFEDLLLFSHIPSNPKPTGLLILIALAMNKKVVVSDAWDDDWVSVADVSEDLYAHTKSDQGTATVFNHRSPSDRSESLESGKAS